MEIEFKKVSEFTPGILHRLLVDSYSFDLRWQACFESDWIAFDTFFFEHLDLADQYGFITTLDGKPIGHISWDPRNRPNYVVVGHNCIAARYKGNGYGKLQLQEAVRRICHYKGLKKIIVTTNGKLIPAQRNYESVGFTLINKRKNNEDSAFSGDYMEYEMIL